MRVMKFEKYPIHDRIKRNIASLGFKKPTDIQYKSIPSILNKEDVLAVAQTGTGKTAAFAIPVIQLVIESKKRNGEGVKCMVLAPTHELVIQLAEAFEELGRGTGIRVVSVYGGVEQDPQIKSLNRGADIVVATPGRMFDLMHQGFLRVKSVEVLILDEADHMLDMGFIHDIRQLTKKLPKKRQTLFFSATINEKIKKLAYSLIRQSAIRIQISPKDPVSKNVEHAVLFIQMDDKRFFLEKLINENPEDKILVFVRTKVRADRVQKAMERVKISSVVIHSDKSQEERDKAMDAFREGNEKILIATDITARGIDIPDVQMVVNYDLPDKAENYVHRVGRTGRGKQKGQAVSFCSDSEKTMLKEIESYIHKPIQQIELTKSMYREVLFFKNEREYDWKRLLEEDNEFNKKKKKKRR